jgi:hypothetical protein
MFRGRLYAGRLYAGRLFARADSEGALAAAALAEASATGVLHGVAAELHGEATSDVSATGALPGAELSGGATAEALAEGSLSGVAAELRGDAVDVVSATGDLETHPFFVERQKLLAAIEEAPYVAEIRVPMRRLAIVVTSLYESEDTSAALECSIDLTNTIL